MEEDKEEVLCEISYKDLDGENFSIHVNGTGRDLVDGLTHIMYELLKDGMPEVLLLDCVKDALEAFKEDK